MPDSSDSDGELKALQTIVALLMDYDYTTRQRILDYLKDRHEKTPDDKQ